MTKTAVATADNYGEGPLESTVKFLRAADSWRKSDHPEYRQGQAYMNYLRHCGAMGEELYNLFTGSSWDPFYTENKNRLQVWVGMLHGYLG